MGPPNHGGRHRPRPVSADPPPLPSHRMVVPPLLTSAPIPFHSTTPGELGDLSTGSVAIDGPVADAQSMRFGALCLPSFTGGWSRATVGGRSLHEGRMAPPPPPIPPSSSAPGSCGHPDIPRPPCACMRPNSLQCPHTWGLSWQGPGDQGRYLWGGGSKHWRWLEVGPISCVKAFTFVHPPSNQGPLGALSTRKRGSRWCCPMFGCA